MILLSGRVIPKERESFIYLLAIALTIGFGHHELRIRIPLPRHATQRFHAVNRSQSRVGEQQTKYPDKQSSQSMFLLQYWPNGTGK